MMSKKKRFDVEDAYALQTPDDSIRLYGEWAPTYDSDFVKASAYILYRNIAGLLLERKSMIDGVVLDVGCGTGMVGEHLRKGGMEDIDGIDISLQMLAEAGNKMTTDGNAVYRNLFAADLTTDLELDDDQYAGLVSAGTFTHGHLGPDSLNELWRIAAPGAICAIGVRSTHFESMRFGEALSVAVRNRLISEPEFVEVNIYSEEADDIEHANDKARVILCQVI